MTRAETAAIGVWFVLVSGCNSSPIGLLADTVYRNGIVITMNGDQIAQAVAVRGDEIIAVGSDSDIHELGDK